MHEDMRTLLNAYLDGELYGLRLLEMQTHLASCAACRNELKELRHISNLLHADSHPELPSAERFISQLTLSLPRRPLRDRPLKTGSMAGWLGPVGLLGAWFFVQTVFTLTTVITAVKMTGLLGQAALWLGGGQDTIWFNAATNLLGRQAAGAQLTLSLLNKVSVFGAILLSGFLWQALIVLLFWVWLSIWWSRGGLRSMKMPNAS
jgi:anti-sigma factor RsiW